MGVAVDVPLCSGAVLARRMIDWCVRGRAERELLPRSFRRGLVVAGRFGGWWVIRGAGQGGDDVSGTAICSAKKPTNLCQRGLSRRVKVGWNHAVVDGAPSGVTDEGQEMVTVQDKTKTSHGREME